MPTTGYGPEHRVNIVKKAKVDGKWNFFPAGEAMPSKSITIFGKTTLQACNVGYGRHPREMLQETKIGRANKMKHL